MGARLLDRIGGRVAPRLRELLGEALEGIGRLMLEIGEIVGHLALGKNVDAFDQRTAVADDMPIDGGGAAARIAEALAGPHEGQSFGERGRVERQERPRRDPIAGGERREPCGDIELHGMVG